MTDLKPLLDIALIVAVCASIAGCALLSLIAADETPSRRFWSALLGLTGGPVALALVPLLAAIAAVVVVVAAVAWCIVTVVVALVSPFLDREATRG